MKILFSAAECVPFIKTGGLADVVGALSPVLAAKGHDVRVMIPLYGQIPESFKNQLRHACDFEIDLGWRKQYCGIEELKYRGVTFYFVDNKFYFNRSYIYGMGGDEFERFGFFSRACLNALPLLGFQPDIVHCHDWQSGMVPALLKIQYAHLPFFAKMKTVYTIHNLQYQGIFSIRDVQDIMGLGDSLFTNDKLECYGCANYMKAGLVYADEITTVSPSYAEEIQTAYYGERLDGLLRAKNNHLSGILNGIDVVEYDPTADPLIPAHFTVDDLSGKKICKRELQKELGLTEDENAPILAIISRLNNQKGLDLIDYVISDIMNEGVQFVVLGMGDSRYVNLFSWAEQQYPGRVVARFCMDPGLAHRVYAGADIFLMPSQFEPCGLSQMLAMRYGTIPLVRETGGLRDTVLSYNDYNDAGNGFSFFNYNAHDMLFTLRRALNYYRKEPAVWEKLQKRGMSGDYSWDHSADIYLKLYDTLLAAPVAAPVKTADAAVAEAPAAVAETPAEAPAAAAEPAPAKKAPRKTVKKAEPKEAKEPKAPKAPKETKEAKEPKAPRKPRTPKEPKA